VGLLVGSFVFVADLVRAFYRIGCNPSVEFMRLNSYGIGRESSGNVRLIGEFELDLSGRAVLLVDDIVDTGRTLLYARDLLREKQASSILTCALVDKPSRMRRRSGSCARAAGGQAAAAPPSVTKSFRRRT
jgi:hypoxanthine phosphoribosyltransferase